MQIQDWTIITVTAAEFECSEPNPSPADPLAKTRQELHQLVDQGKRFLCLDLKGIPALSTAALSVLIGLNKKLFGVGGKFRLCNVHPDLVKLLEIVKLDKLFEGVR